MKQKGSGGIFRGTLLLSVSTLLIKVLGVIYKIPLASYLGDEGMGYFNSAYTVYAFFYLVCTAGVPKAVMILESREDRAGSGQRIKSALYSFGIFGLLMSLLLIVLSIPISRAVGSSRAAFTLVSIAPSIFFVSLDGVLRGKLSADMRFGHIAVCQLIEAVGRLVFGLFLASLSVRLCFPLPIVSALTILGVTIGAILGYIYMYICYKTKNKDEKAGQRYTYNKSCVKEILRISIPITLSAAVMSGSNLIDLSLIMRNLLGLGYTEETATAIYGNYTTLAVPMFNLAISLISPISIAFVPIFSKCAAEKKQGLLTEAAYTSLSLINCLSVPMSLGLFVYAEPILRLLFKGSDIILGTQLLKLLTPAIIFMGMLTVTNSLLESLGEVRVPVYSMLLGSVLKIICTLILIKNPLYGIKAAPIGTVLCYAVALIFSLYSLGRKTKIFVPVLRKTLLPFANTLTALLLTKPLFTRLSELIGETVSLFIIIVIIALIYIALTFICTVLFDKKILKLAKYTNFA